jgi:hypothetical protein
MIALFLYGIVAWLVTSFLLSDDSLCRLAHIPGSYAAWLCAYCKTPDRETLVSIVAGILWPALLAAFLAGLVWYAFAAQHRGLRQW